VSILDWIFIGLFSFAILFFLFSILLLFSLFSTKKKIRFLSGIRKKNKRKRIKLKRERRRLEGVYKRQLINVIVLLVLAFICGGGSFYSRYYQANSLSERDSDAIVQGYYLIEQIDLQLKEAENNDNKTKIANNIKELSGRLSSYGNRLANQRLTVEGQGILNKQFKIMMELGINLAAQQEDFLKNPEKMSEFNEDLEKAKLQQKKVFEHFNINEAALKKKN